MRVRFWVEGFTDNNTFVSHFLKLETTNGFFSTVIARVYATKDKNDATIVEDSRFINQVVEKIAGKKDHIIRAVMENVDTGETTELI